MRRSRAGRPAKEPTAAEIAAIEREWPLIVAKLAVVDAEIAVASADGAASPMDVRRLRKAERAARDAAAQVLARRTRRSRRTA